VAQALQNEFRLKIGQANVVAPWASSITAECEHLKSLQSMMSQREPFQLPISRRDLLIAWMAPAHFCR